MKKATIVVVGAFIVDDQNRLFLAKCAEKFDRKWTIPGGKIDFGETPIEAVKREVQEETNINIEDPTYVTNGAFTYDNKHIVFIDFCASFPKGSEIKLNSEFSEWGFFSLDELKHLDLMDATRENLKAIKLDPRSKF